MVWIYSLGIHFYILSIRIAALFNAKARKWVRGRKGMWAELAVKREALPADRPLVWIHCASLGEFEQGRPVIEGLKRAEPDILIALTFFSPSGYEIRKNYEFADLISYLPADMPANARKFIRILQPDLTVFVKYEFWYHHLEHLHREGIPTLLVSALFRKEQAFFKWYGGLFRKLLPWFEGIYVQNQSSLQLLKDLDLTNIIASGDTRIDRVLAIAEKARTFPTVAQFAADHKVLIAGSSWPADEQLIQQFLEKNWPEGWKLIIAPHQIDPGHLRQIENNFSTPVLLYSESSPEKAGAARILVIDNIGMLSALYHYGDIAYIGGGFGAGIHNTLEPVAFGLPVLFGPRYRKFEEAVYLVEHGGAKVVRNAEDLRRAFQDWLVEAQYQQSSEIARSYIQHNQGSSKKIVQEILARLKN